jgi:hypothetical protein
VQVPNLRLAYNCEWQSRFMSEVRVAPSPGMVIVHNATKAEYITLVDLHHHFFSAYLGCRTQP